MSAPADLQFSFRALFVFSTMMAIVLGLVSLGSRHSPESTAAACLVASMACLACWVAVKNGLLYLFSAAVLYATALFVLMLVSPG